MLPCFKYNSYSRKHFCQYTILLKNYVKRDLPYLRWSFFQCTYCCLYFLHLTLLDWSENTILCLYSKFFILGSPVEFFVLYVGPVTLDFRNGWPNPGIGNKLFVPLPREKNTEMFQCEMLL